MIANDTLGELAIAESTNGGVPDVVGFDYFQTIISQFSNSPIILALIKDFASYLDLSVDFDAFYRLCWNVDTAVGYGLDRLGRVVGVSRVLHLPAAGDYFGFSESSDGRGFGQAPFYSGASALTTNFSLSDDAYRRLILAKALANICDGSIPAINQILINLFGSYGDCYVTDNLDMTITYHFQTRLNEVDYAIVAQSGVLPKPCGVAASIVQP